MRGRGDRMGSECAGQGHKGEGEGDASQYRGRGTGGSGGDRMYAKTA